MSPDRVGLGWRPELAAGILSNRHRLDLVEVIADDLFGAPKKKLQAVQTLSRFVPVTLHGVSLGLASTEGAEPRRLDQLARVVNAVKPQVWSEHLAFVRGGGRELGHLAAPPRTQAIVDGFARNLARARKVVGVEPLLENVATLIDPPGSTLGEGEWVSACADAAGVGLLLDLNNLYSNAVNFGLDPFALLSSFPLQAVRAVHLAGGKWVSASNGDRRLLDDHLHDVPETVYALLREVGARCPHPLNVVLERDGQYPPIELLLAQLDRARLELAAERRARVATAAASASRPVVPQPSTASFTPSQLAALYLEPQRLQSDPRRAQVDATGFELAVRSFARKRALKAACAHAHGHG